MATAGTLTTDNTSLHRCHNIHISYIFLLVDREGFAPAIRTGFENDVIRFLGANSLRFDQPLTELSKKVIHRFSDTLSWQRRL
jgi:hypothetical protein